MKNLKFAALSFAILLPFIFHGVVVTRDANFSMSNTSVDDLINSANNAFVKAEREVFDTQPKPDEDIIRPNPDPKKCPCRGTGKIVHGDGHTTECPFHGAGLIIKQHQ